jgi:hypothetical protein
MINAIAALFIALTFLLRNNFETVPQGWRNNRALWPTAFVFFVLNIVMALDTFVDGEVWISLW